MVDQVLQLLNKRLGAYPERHPLERGTKGLFHLAEPINSIYPLLDQSRDGGYKLRSLTLLGRRPHCLIIVNIDDPSSMHVYLSEGSRDFRRHESLVEQELAKELSERGIQHTHFKAGQSEYDLQRRVILIDDT